MNKLSNRFVNRLLIAAGTFFVGLGFVGIFIPLLPTTPFLLLAAACYARGSKRFYNWLTRHKWFGTYIKNYREGRGIPLRAKIMSLALLWLTIGYSSIFVVPMIWGKIILASIAVGVTFHIILMKTLKKKDR